MDIDWKESGELKDYFKNEEEEYTLYFVASSIEYFGKK